MTEDGSNSSEKFREFVKKTARLLVPEDDVEDMRERRKQAVDATGCREEVADEDVIVNANDEFLCGEALTLWRLIREARELLDSFGGQASVSDEEAP